MSFLSQHHLYLYIFILSMSCSCNPLSCLFHLHLTSYSLHPYISPPHTHTCINFSSLTTFTSTIPYTFPPSQTSLLFPLTTHTHTHTQYLPLYQREMPNYPDISLDNSYLISRTDGSIVDAKEYTNKVCSLPACGYSLHITQTTVGICTGGG